MAPRKKPAAGKGKKPAKKPAKPSRKRAAPQQQGGRPRKRQRRTGLPNRPSHQKPSPQVNPCPWRPVATAEPREQRRELPAGLQLPPVSIPDVPDLPSRPELLPVQLNEMDLKMPREFDEPSQYIIDLGRRIRFRLGPILTTHKNGDLDFWGFSPIDAMQWLNRKMNPKELALMYKGLEEHGVRNLLPIRKGLWYMSSTQLLQNTCKLLGSGNLNHYTGWHPTKEQCQAERERNFRIGMAAKCIDRKTGLLHNEKKKLDKWIEKHPECSVPGPAVVRGELASQWYTPTAEELALAASLPKGPSPVKSPVDARWRIFMEKAPKKPRAGGGGKGKARGKARPRARPKAKPKPRAKPKPKSGVKRKAAA